MLPADDALERLREGNRRFVASRSTATRPTELPEQQQPFAIVLGCSDARVPAEIVFDQGLGDLFVIRVAGNVVAPSQIGSVEFAAAQFGVQLVVVLGHSRCGAVMATIDELQQPSENRSPNLRSIVDRVRPSVAGLMETDLRHDHEALLRESVRANIRMSVAQLQNGSVILESLIADRGLRIVGAEYSLESGEVRFLDDLDGV